MRLPVQTFQWYAHAISGGAPQGLEAVKRALVAMAEAQKRQCLRDLGARGSMQAHTTRNLRRTPEQWREVPLRTRAPPKHISEVP